MVCKGSGSWLLDRRLVFRRDAQQAEFQLAHLNTAVQNTSVEYDSIGMLLLLVREE